MVKKKRHGACFTMKLMICDDNAAFARELRRRIEDICAYEDRPLDCLIFEKPQDVLNADLYGVKAAFLDIEMPGGNGIELAKQLRIKYPEMILVFVTAYIEYAPSGYKVDAFRYLLKSKVDEELREILEGIRERLYNSSDVVSLKTRDGDCVLPLKDVLYFEGTAQRMVLAHVMGHEGPVTCQGKLSALEESLSGKGFLRIQKSFLVNMAHLRRISGYRAFISNGKELKVSELNYSKIREQYLLWKGSGL